MFDGVEVDVGLLVGVMEGVKVVTAHAGTESSRPVGSIVLRFSS